MFIRNTEINLEVERTLQMNNWLIKLLFSALGVITGAYLLPGIYVESFWTAIIVAFLLSILNVTLKPILIVLTIPVTVMTLGLFLLILNALMIEAVDYFVSGFIVDNFWWALIFSLILTVINSLFKDLRKKD